MWTNDDPTPVSDMANERDALDALIEAEGGEWVEFDTTPNHSRRWRIQRDGNRTQQWSEDADGWRDDPWQLLQSAYRKGREVALAERIPSYTEGRKKGYQEAKEQMQELVNLLLMADSSWTEYDFVRIDRHHWKKFIEAARKVKL